MSLCKSLSWSEFNQMMLSKKRALLDSKEVKFISELLSKIDGSSIYNRGNNMEIIINNDDDTEDQIVISKHDDDWWSIKYNVDRAFGGKGTRKIYYSFYLLDTLDGLKDFVNLLDY